MRDQKVDDARSRRALILLDSKRNDRYEAALAAVHYDTRQWLNDLLETDPDDLEDGQQTFTADPDVLLRFIETEALRWYDRRPTELANRPLIRDQAFGESLNADKPEVLARYEVHLDRKLERMLTILVRLKALRSGAAPSCDRSSAACWSCLFRKFLGDC